MAAYDYKNFECYKILNISSTAGPQEIRKAYLNKSKECHPDVGGSNEQQLKLNLAYEILSDPIEREQYDRYLKSSYKSPPGHTGRQSEQGGTRSKSKRSATLQLFKRITNAIDQEIRTLNSEGREWVRTRIKFYKDEIESWKKEQETIFNEDVEHYNSEFSMKSRLRRRLFYATILLVESALFSTLISFALYIFSLDYLPLMTLLAVSLWSIGIISWLWFSTTKWVEIEGQKIDTSSNQAGKKIRSILHQSLLSKWRRINSEVILFGDDDWLQKINTVANAEWLQIFNKKKADILAKKDKHLMHAAEISNLLERAITFDTSEEQVARRIAATFFLMGYYPISYDAQYRMLVFSDGGERVVVRFRHRSGIPTNISYVKRMVSTMLMNRAQRGYLFCTPGLSENGAKLARKYSIKWYSLETMNEWIDNVLSSNYAGPSGNIFELIEDIVFFLRQMWLYLPNR